MLDPTCLPKNANGFRTTHTCELCGFEPKTKNKYREKQDHLVMKHFKDRIDKIFPHCRPYTCPNAECDFTGKDKQALLRHYTGKHGVLELYLREALAEKGIQYNLSDSAKRKSMSHHSDHGQRKAKEARLSPPIIQTNIQLSAITTLPEIRQHHTTTTVLEQPSPIMAADTTTTISSGSELHDLAFSTPITRLPPINSTTLSSMLTTKLLPPITRLPSMSTTKLPPMSTTKLPSMSTTKLPSMSTVLTRPYNSHGKCDVDALLASFQPIDTQLIGPSSHDLPLDSPLVSSTTPDIFCSLPDEPSKVLLNDNIMWSGGSLAVSEAAQTVPVQYLESSDHGFVNLNDIDFDFMYPTSIEPAAVLATSGQERQLSFSML